MPRVNVQKSKEKEAAPTATVEKKAEVAKVEPGETKALTVRELTSDIEHRVRELTGGGQLELPRNYSVENAMKAAWLKIQEVQDKDGRRALDVCTPASISNALLDMVVQGLTPARDQCYFVAYGKKLVCMRSYFGTAALLKRVYGPEADVVAEVIYNGDEFEYEIEAGRKRVKRHVQSFTNVDDAKIAGAYAIVTVGERVLRTEIMTRAQLEAAWSMGSQTGSAHEKFVGEMAKKTVINRACKVVIRASDDSYLADVVDRQELLTAEAAIDAEADERANRRLITFVEDDELVEGEVVDADTGEILDEESAITAEVDERLAAAEGAEPVAGPGF